VEVVREVRATRQAVAAAVPAGVTAAQDRLTAYRETLQGTASGRSLPLGDFTRISGAAAMRQLLDDDPQLDAVFAANDLMAIGALRTLRDAGRRVPDDVAVVGFDDIDAALYPAHHRPQPDGRPGGRNDPSVARTACQRHRGFRDPTDELVSRESTWKPSATSPVLRSPRTRQARCRLRVRGTRQHS
jgi:hypothetical protein